MLPKLQGHSVHNISQSFTLVLTSNDSGSTHIGSSIHTNSNGYINAPTVTKSTAKLVVSKQATAAARNQSENGSSKSTTKNKGYKIEYGSAELKRELNHNQTSSGNDKLISLYKMD
jgi:hypothetical protein